MRQLSLMLLMALTACSSMIMESYIGQTLAEPILDYGEPASTMDMPDGTRAFIWQMRSTSYVPQTTTVSSHTYANGNTFGNSFYGNANTTSSAVTYGGYAVTEDCTYVLYAKKTDENENPSSWIVTGYRKPRLSCE